MTSSEQRAPAPRRDWFDRLPLMVVTGWAGAALMLVPALYAGLTGDDDTARPFLYGGVLFMVLAGLVGLSTMGRVAQNSARAMLLSLVGTYLLLPLMLALPVLETVRGLSFSNAYFEMVSSLTTTGATVFDQPSRAPDAVHLWRALVGWYGGFIIWVAAIAVLSPLRLGGFEVVQASARLGRDVSAFGEGPQAPMRRVRRFVRALAPVYCGLTFAVWLGLLIAGETPLVAACHAMSAISTSGISPLATLEQAQSGRWGEVLLALAMVFGLSRALFARDIPRPVERRIWQDPELRLAAAILVATPLLIFGHHWVARLTLTAVAPESPADALQSLWGAAFTSLSFLTTTGFASADWAEARDWSGIGTPGLILLGLAMVGGGVATTAGGVKLLRVYVLYQHGQFEMKRLVHPSIVASPGHRARRFDIQAAFVAWLFFMIFALSLATTMLALSLSGVGFETGLILTTAALTTTGPLVTMAGDAPILVAQLSVWSQVILCGAMVLGRLETLALVALLNPEFWRA